MATAELSEHIVFIYVQFMYHLLFTGPPEWGCMVNTIHMFAYYIFKCMRAQANNKLSPYILAVFYFILFSSASEDFRKYMLLKAFSLVSRSLFLSSPLLSSPSLCHLVSAPLLFVPWFHCSVLQFQHFNISSNISRAESSGAELFSTTGNLGEEKSGTRTHTYTHTHTHTHTHARANTNTELNTHIL